MNSLLHLGIDLNHALIQVRVLPHQHFRIPRSSHKQSVNPTAQRRSEAVRDLQSDQESVGDDYRREIAVGIVAWVREEEVEVREAVMDC